MRSIFEQYFFCFIFVFLCHFFNLSFLSFFYPPLSQFNFYLFLVVLIGVRERNWSIKFILLFLLGFGLDLFSYAPWGSYLLLVFASGMVVAFWLEAFTPSAWSLLVLFLVLALLGGVLGYFIISLREGVCPTAIQILGVKVVEGLAHLAIFHLFWGKLFLNRLENVE